MDNSAQFPHAVIRVGLCISVIISCVGIYMRVLNPWISSLSNLEGAILIKCIHPVYALPHN